MGIVEGVRWEVWSRDQGCVARKVDEHAGPCRDAWGGLIPDAGVDVGEMDYVRLDSVGPRHVLPEDHVWLCPGHHRGTGPSKGYVWATAHRPELRAYLGRVA